MFSFKSAALSIALRNAVSSARKLAMEAAGAFQRPVRAAEAFTRPALPARLSKDTPRATAIRQTVWNDGALRSPVSIRPSSPGSSRAARARAACDSFRRWRRSRTARPSDFATALCFDAAAANYALGGGTFAKLAIASEESHSGLPHCPNWRQKKALEVHRGAGGGVERPVEVYDQAAEGVGDGLG